jgi:hypothetical protein
LVAAAAVVFVCEEERNSLKIKVRVGAALREATIYDEVCTVTFG